jgi:uncharacterized membrane protein
MEKFLNWLEKPNVLATAKTVTYRLFSTGTTFATMMFFTGGNVKESGGITLIFGLYKPIQFWIHERVWLIWENKRVNARSHLSSE